MIIIGTRGSALALAQTTWIKERILQRFPDIEVSLKIIKTSADKDTTSSLRSASSVGVFVKELEQALREEQIDIAVHSMKDVPTRISEGLEISAIPEREDARDAFISGQAKSLLDLPHGATIGTGSVRRQAQILALRPDLRIMDIRGNVDTRLKKLQDGIYDAVILACAGLRRLGLQQRITSPLDYAQMLPAPGQGALAIETRCQDSRVRAIVSPLNHLPSAIAVSAERTFLQRLGGGCNVPIAAYVRITQDIFEMDALAASPDGQRIVRDSVRENVKGIDEAVASLADAILSRGGRAILNECLGNSTVADKSGE
jgi:hydroxymethylbilane synthase